MLKWYLDDIYLNSSINRYKTVVSLLKLNKCKNITNFGNNETLIMLHNLSINKAKEVIKKNNQKIYLPQYGPHNELFKTNLN